MTSRAIAHRDETFGRLALPFRRVAATTLIAACGFVVAGDHPLAPVRLAIIFVGTAEESTDPIYRAYRTALDTIDPNWRARMSVQHIRTDTADDAAMQRAISRTLASRPPALLVAPTGSAMFASARSDADVAILFASHADPRREGVVASLRRPGGRATGVSQHDELDVKRLELLRDAFPGVRRVRVLADRFWVHAFDRQGLFAAAAQRLGLNITMEHADSPEELDALMRAPDAADADAWYIPPTYIAYVAEQAVIDHLARLGLPSIHATVREVERGAPLAYMQDTSFVYSAMAALTLRIVRGENPAGIPVERPKRTILAVRAGVTCGPPIDPAVVRRADRVVH